MSLPALDNLVRIGQLKPEPSNVPEFERMLEMARTSLADACLTFMATNATPDDETVRPEPVEGPFDRLRANGIAVVSR